MSAVYSNASVGTAGASPTRRRRKILIIDDVSMFRELGSLFLARTADVVTASGGMEGLELAQREKPDLIITDLHMPDLDGEALCRAIKNDPQLCETPVIIMLSTNCAPDRARAVRAGADDLLAKPLSRFALVDLVNRFVMYDEVRGLPRVSVVEPIRLCAQRYEAWGTLRNLSCGGVFVEIDDLLDPWAEVALEFSLPEIQTSMESTAQVIWQRSRNGSPSGMGLRFLEIDPRSARSLEDYVWEHALDNRGALPQVQTGVAG